MQYAKRPRSRTVLAVLCSLLVLGGVQVAHPTTAHAMPASCSGGPHCGTTVTATASNTYGDYVLLDLVDFNNDPTLLIQATQVTSSAYDAHPIGLWYDTYLQKWAIVNEDLANIPLGATFYLTGTFGPDGPYQVGDGSVWADTQVTSTTANVDGDGVAIDSSVTNGNPNAQVYVTQVSASVFDLNPHEVGVYYNTWLQKWLIFNEDMSAMPVGMQFNVTLTNEQNTSSQLVTATASSISGTFTFISVPFTPGKFTQVYDANGACGCVLNPHPVALESYTTWWGGTYKVIANVDAANMPTNAEFFVRAF
jgi:hypothetical protein